MTKHAESSFEITSWDEDVVADLPGYKLIRTHIVKTFTGDVAGTSIAECLMLHTQLGPVAYVGFERLTVELGGKKGDFALHHTAGSRDGVPAVAWSVIPGSGTGGLSEISGDATITRHDDGSHTFTLDYDMG